MDWTTFRSDVAELTESSVLLPIAGLESFADYFVQDPKQKDLTHKSSPSIHTFLCTMVGQKRTFETFECTVDEALNDFCYDPEITPTDKNKRKKKRVYEPIPLDSSHTDTTAGLLLSPSSLVTLNPTKHDKEDKEDDSGPLPVKNKVCRCHCSIWLFVTYLFE